jgi:hypothetical protein
MQFNAVTPLVKLGLFGPVKSFVIIPTMEQRLR